jgi:hypothetical protein
LSRRRPRPRERGPAAHTSRGTPPHRVGLLGDRPAAPRLRCGIHAADPHRRCQQSGPSVKATWRSSSPRARSPPSQRVGSADRVSGSCTAGSRRSIASAWRRVESPNAPYRCRTKVRSWGVVMGAAACAAERRSGPVRDRPNASRASVARQVNRQRGRYAGAVLRSLARSQQGRPTAHIQRLLRNSLTPLGVRLSSAKLHQLATDIAAGRPVALP